MLFAAVSESVSRSWREEALEDVVKPTEVDGEILEPTEAEVLECVISEEYEFERKSLQWCAPFGCIGE